MCLKTMFKNICIFYMYIVGENNWTVYSSLLVAFCYKKNNKKKILENSMYYQSLINIFRVEKNIKYCFSQIPYT